MRISLGDVGGELDADKDAALRTGPAEGELLPKYQCMMQDCEHKDDSHIGLIKSHNDVLTWKNIGSELGSLAKQDLATGKVSKGTFMSVMQ